MINQYEVPAYLIQELPEMDTKLKTASPTLNIFKTVQCLSGYTKDLIKAQNLNAVNKVMKVAGDIYEQGTEEVKNAFENIFVYAFTAMMCMCDSSTKKALRSVIPVPLYSAYLNQVHCSGK